MYFQCPICDLHIFGADNFLACLHWYGTVSSSSVCHSLATPLLCITKDFKLLYSKVAYAQEEGDGKPREGYGGGEWEGRETRRKQWTRAMIHKPWVTLTDLMMLTPMFLQTSLKTCQDRKCRQCNQRENVDYKLERINMNPKERSFIVITNTWQTLKRVTS